MRLRTSSTVNHLVALVAIGLAAVGCAGPSGGASMRSHLQIQNVACLYGRTPWLNYDKAGDMDPEGIGYRVFLDPGTGRGVEAIGTFHVEMYQLKRDLETGKSERVLVSDWHYTTDHFSRVKSSFLGIGYLLKLRWAKKSLAGSEIELITRFEALDGQVTAAGTKRLRIPKYNP